MVWHWVLTLICLAPKLWAVPSGRTHFLSHGPGAMEESLGEAVAGAAAGPASVYYNPAGLSQSPSAITGEWTKLLPGVNYSWLGVSFDVKVAQMGLGLVSLDLGEVTARSGLNDAGSIISSYQRAYFIGSARQVAPGLWAGTTLGLLDYDLGGYKSKAFFSDAGAIYQPGRTVRLGLALKNLYFSGLDFGGERERYPAEVRLGASFERYGLAALAQVGQVLDGSEPSFGFGLGYSLFGLLHMRAGLNGHPRFGFGLSTKGGRFALDVSHRAGPVSAAQRVGVTYFFRPWQDSPTDPYAELTQRARSLASYYWEESKRLLETGSPEGMPALRKVLALQPDNREAAKALSSETGVSYPAVRPSRWGFLPWERTRRTLYLRFAVDYAEDSKAGACAAGQRFIGRWPKDSRSLLISQLLEGHGCGSEQTEENKK